MKLYRLTAWSNGRKLYACRGEGQTIAWSTAKGRLWPRREALALKRRLRKFWPNLKLEAAT